MTINIKHYGRFLDQVATDLDIPAGKYQQAVDRYNSVGHWLEEGEYFGCFGDPSIYVQGSFRLGTVVRPLINGDEADYDIDLVCELPIHKQLTDPKSIKEMVGGRIKEHVTYTRMLDDEGKRCWTLHYAEEDGIGFHMDVLPSIPDDGNVADASIAVTHKDEDEYSWSPSNPNGYAEWFHEKNATSFLLAESYQKQSLYKSNAGLYASVDDVPDQLVRTPLQRAIQIMKRHRDQRFNGHEMAEYRPISMIITTLAASLYHNETDVFSALQGIVRKLHAHSALLQSGIFMESPLSDMKLIQRRGDGTWHIANPVNPDENFADRWHEDNQARAKSFFVWVEWLKNDLVEILSSQDSKSTKKLLVESFGDKLVEKNFHLLAMQSAPPVITPRQVNSTSQPQPWKR